jgi:uncharacterized protein YdeI (YjbR/CyaY-like superfamily)
MANRPLAPLFFATGALFGAWLRAHGGQQNELIVGFWKVGSGQRSMSWSESVDEALCVGWIDGVRQRIDEQAYQIRFTPRRPGSIWSAINLAKVERLQAQGRLQPAGLQAYAGRLAHKSAVYAYEQPQPAALTPEETAGFRQHTTAWAYFEACPPSYRQPVLHRITTAKKAETRARRLQQLIDACALQQRLLR